MATYKYYRSGTHRISTPQETLERVQIYASEMGITRLANITGLDNLGIHVYMACRPNSRSLAVSQGKGITPDAAKVSALMEAVEGFHAERIALPLKILSHDDLLKIHNVINIEELSKLTTGQFNSNIRIPWIAGYDIISQREKWVPYECVHTDYTYPFSYNHGHFISDTNGLASGNNIIEAINHGLYEVIERDALALWSLKKTEASKNKLHLNSISIPFIQKALKQIEASNSFISIWDITSDIGVPTYICKILDDQNNSALRIRHAYGSGTHLSKDIAIIRALTEAAQSRLTFIAGTRDDQYIPIYDKQISDENHKRWYRDISAPSQISFENRRSFNNETLESDLELIVSSLKSVGISEIVYVDITSEKYKIPVVKVIVPGLEGISYSGKRIIGKRGREALE